MLTINNPIYTIRLIDLIDTVSYEFNYDSIYDTVGDFLKDLKPCYYDSTEWNAFIILLCDRFYNRNLNFDTFLEFKIALKNVLNENKDKAIRMRDLLLKSENIFDDYRRKYHRIDSGINSSHVTGANENSNIENHRDTTNGVNTSQSSDTSEVSDKNKSYNLYSDTPSNTVNLTDLTSKDSNYVTNATNEGSENTNNTKSKNDSNSSFNNSSSGERTNVANATNVSDTDGSFKNESDEDVSEIHGSDLEFFEKIKKIQTDINQLYLTWIEDAQIFMNILY